MHLCLFLRSTQCSTMLTRQVTSSRATDQPSRPAGWNVPITKNSPRHVEGCTKVSRMYKLFLYTLSLTSILTVTVIPVRTATFVPIFTIAYASYSAAVAILQTAPILKVKVIILRGHDPSSVLGYVIRGYACSKKWRPARATPRENFF